MTVSGEPEHRWVTDPDDDAIAAAAAHGLVPGRTLLQMRRPLPLPPGRAADQVAEPTRAFDPDADADAWLAVNNAAFAWHLEQGGWTRATLDARMAEPWFDLDGFRIADDPATGAMTGFCWTKVHPAGAAEPADIGEIYVVAVAPERVGIGLGTRLTVAGLDWLWTRRRTPVGMLYVESDNDRALATYGRLGFEVHSTDVCFEPA